MKMNEYFRVAWNSFVVLCVLFIMVWYSPQYCWYYYFSSISMEWVENEHSEKKMKLNICTCRRECVRARGAQFSILILIWLLAAVAGFFFVLFCFVLAAKRINHEETLKSYFHCCPFIMKHIWIEKKKKTNEISWPTIAFSIYIVLNTHTHI